MPPGLSKLASTHLSTYTIIKLDPQRVSEPAQHRTSTLPTRKSTKPNSAIDLTYFSTGRDAGRVDENDEPLHRGLWAAWYASAED